MVTIKFPSICVYFLLPNKEIKADIKVHMRSLVHNMGCNNSNITDPSSPKLPWKMRNFLILGHNNSPTKPIVTIPNIMLGGQIFSVKYTKNNM